MDTHVQVIVVGGGVSGVCSALAAAKNAESVLLIESSDTLGGIATEGPLEALMTFHDERGQVVEGIAQEIVNLLVSCGGSPGFVPDTVGYCKSIVPYDSELLRLTLLKMLRDAEVKFFLNCMLTNVETEFDQVKAVVVTSNTQSIRFTCDVLIDASGDGNATRLAGGSLLFGRNGDNKVQPMSTLFKIAGVDTRLLRQYVQDHPQEFKIAVDADLDAPYLHLWGFTSVLASGIASGTLSLHRNEIQLMMTPREGVVVVNFSRVVGDPRNPEVVSGAQRQTLEQCHELMAHLRNSIDAFKHAHIVHTGKVGIRESNRVSGRYELQMKDILDGMEFQTTVARGAFPIDIHQPDGDSLVCKMVARSYAIPMESLRAKDFLNLFMCGRCICATHEALASARITATAMATGHAAGVMASVYLEDNTVPYSAVRSRLLAQSAIL